MAHEVEREEFRRAVGRRDPEAWAALWARYHRLLGQWVARDPTLPYAGETVEDLAARAFARFWQGCRGTTVAAEWEVAGYLAYLKRCAASVVRDAAQVEMRHPELRLHVARVRGEPLEEWVVDRLAAAELWGAIWGGTKGEAERAIARGLRAGLPPGAIQAAHPDLFPDMASVYGTKRCFVERLRRQAARASA